MKQGDITVIQPNDFYTKYLDGIKLLGCPLPGGGGWLKLVKFTLVK